MPESPTTPGRSDICNSEPDCRKPSWLENIELRAKKAIKWGLPHFSCCFLIGALTVGIGPHASKINMDAGTRRQNYGRGTRWRSLDNFCCRAGDRLLSWMRSAIATTAQSIFALSTGLAGARSDRRIESPDDALALSERVVRAKDIFRSASRRRCPTCASDITRWPPSSAICAWRRR